MFLHYKIIYDPLVSDPCLQMFVLTRVTTANYPRVQTKISKHVRNLLLSHMWSISCSYFVYFRGVKLDFIPHIYMASEVNNLILNHFSPMR